MWSSVFAMSRHGGRSYRPLLVGRRRGRRDGSSRHTCRGSVRGNRGMLVLRAGRRDRWGRGGGGGRGGGMGMGV